MRKFIPILLLLLIVAGCLDAKLSQGEIATCMRASSAELTHIPPCTTSTSCQNAFRKTQESGIGTLTDSSTFVERAEREAISGWLRVTDAVQRLQKVRNACTNGSIGELWGHAQQAGTTLGEALLHSEKSQIYSWQALQQTIRVAERMELDEVRDSKAFEAFASAVEAIQEVKTHNPRSILAQKVESNNQYFATLAKRISGKDPGTYDIDIASGFELLKTPVKILEPGNTGKLIIAFFPTWNSFLNSVRTRKNAIKGVQVLEELSASEMIYHAEMGIAPNQGIHAMIVQKIRSVEEGIMELREEEAHHSKEAEKKLIAITQEIRSTQGKWKEYREEYEWLEARERDVLYAPMEKIKHVEDAIQSLTMLKERLITEYTKNTKPLGKRISSWRGWQLQFAEARSEIETVKQLHLAAENACRKLGKEIMSEDTADPIRLVAKEVVEANDDKAWDYCTALIKKLKKNVETITSTSTTLKEKSSLIGCVNETNAYINSMNLGDELSEAEWLSAHHHDMALAYNACESARRNMETTYAQSASVIRWNTLREEAHELIAVGRQLEAIEKNQSRLSGARVKITQLLNAEKSPVSFDDIENNTLELGKRMEELREQIKDALQEAAKEQRWKVVSPARAILNEEEDAVLRWEMKNPAGRTIDFPIVLVINPVPESEIIESTAAWSLDGQKIIVTATQWSSPIRITAKRKGVIAQATKETNIGELIGNQARIRIALEVNAKADTTLQLEMQQYGIKSREVIEVHDGDGKNYPLRQEEALVPLQKENTRIIIDAVLQEVIRTNTTLTGVQTRNGIQFTTYGVEWENTSEKRFRLSAGTGIRLDPIETLSIQVIDELGASTSWTDSEVEGIIIDSQDIGPKSKRKFSVIITRPEGAESWQALKENLLQEIIHYTASPFPGIATKAISLLHRVEKWNGMDDAKKWAEGLLQWQLELESLASEENGYWQKKAALAERKKLLKEVETPDWKRQRSAVDEFMAENNFTGAENALEWLEKQTLEQEAGDGLQSEQEKPMDKNEKNDALMEITQLNRKVVAARESAAAYAQEQGVACAKLLETNFVCPLSENQIKDIKEELNAIQKELRENEKQLSKETTTIALLGQSLEAVARIQSKIHTIDSRIGGARESLKENAEQTSRTLGEFDFTEEEWKTNIQKVSIAIEEKEYGKAIYIGRNLLAYADSKKAIGSGLAILPEKTLPLLGVVLLVGGAGIMHWWKKKNQKPITLKSVPRASEYVTGLRGQETKNDEPMRPSTKMEPLQ